MIETSIPTEQFSCLAGYTETITDYRHISIDADTLEAIDAYIADYMEKNPDTTQRKAEILGQLIADAMDNKFLPLKHPRPKNVKLNFKPFVGDVVLGFTKTQIVQLDNLSTQDNIKAADYCRLTLSALLLDKKKTQNK